MLNAMVIFNDTVAEEVEDLYPNAVCVYSSNAWNNDELMEVWLKSIIVPHVKNKNAIITLDLYPAHSGKKFQKLLKQYPNIDINFIPGGLTSLHQPVDVVFNKTFKNLMRY